MGMGMEGMGWAALESDTLTGQGMVRKGVEF